MPNAIGNRCGLAWVLFLMMSVLVGTALVMSSQTASAGSSSAPSVPPGRITINCKIVKGTPTSQRFAVSQHDTQSIRLVNCGESINVVPGRWYVQPHGSRAGWKPSDRKIDVKSGKSYLANFTYKR